MAKLKNREMIILAVTFIIIIYGAYSFLSAKTQKHAKENFATEKGSLMSTIAGDLLKSPSNVLDAFIIQKAEADWVKNPFWKKGSYIEWANKDNTKSSDDPASKIIYSGFVETGKKKMAIINGLEYSTGEKLEIEGFILKKITATKIIVGNKKNGSDLVITIQE